MGGSLNPNVKSYATFSAFVLGLTVGVFGLLVVQHAMADETTPSFLKKSFVVNSAPVKNGVQVVSATAMANDEGLVQRSPAAMMEPKLEPSSSFSSFSPAFSSSGFSGSACSRRNALIRAAGVAAAAIGAPGFAAATTVIKMGDDTARLVYEPNEATICKGDSVTWVNNKGGPHNVQFNEAPDGVEADDLGSELIREDGAKFTQTFNVAGEYSYFCSPHGGAGMVGSLSVKA